MGRNPGWSESVRIPAFDAIYYRLMTTLEPRERMP